jgi:transcriptional regulator with XRE-family HTH domain
MQELRLGTVIKILRTKNNVYAKDLIPFLGINHTYLSSVERNHKPPSLKLLGKVSEYFNIPLSEIFRMAENLKQ